MKYFLSIMVTCAVAVTALAQSYSNPGPNITDTPTFSGTNTWSGSNIFSAIGVTGVTNGGSSPAGNVGEFISSLQTGANAKGITTATATNVLNVSLTAGEWNVWGNVNYITTAATVTSWQGGIMTNVSATLPTDGSEIFSEALITTTSATNSIVVPVKRYTVNGSFTANLVGSATFSAGTVKAYGAMYAQRIR